MKPQTKPSPKRIRSGQSCKDRIVPSEVAETPLRIGTFILQKIGSDPGKNPSSGTNDVNVCRILIEILKRYDLLLVMEPRTGEETRIDRLIKCLNTVDRENPFDFEESEAMCKVHGVKEHYCFFYRVNKLSVLDVHCYGEDPFKRSGWEINTHIYARNSSTKRSKSPATRKPLADSGHQSGFTFVSPGYHKPDGTVSTAVVKGNESTSGVVVSDRGSALPVESTDANKTVQLPPPSEEKGGKSEPTTGEDRASVEEASSSRVSHPSTGSAKVPNDLGSSDVGFVRHCVVAIEVNGLAESSSAQRLDKVGPGSNDGSQTASQKEEPTEQATDGGVDKTSGDFTSVPGSSRKDSDDREVAADSAVESKPASPFPESDEISPRSDNLDNGSKDTRKQECHDSNIESVPFKLDAPVYNRKDRAKSLDSSIPSDRKRNLDFQLPSDRKTSLDSARSAVAQNHPAESSDSEVIWATITGPRTVSENKDWLTNPVPVAFSFCTGPFLGSAFPKRNSSDAERSRVTTKDSLEANEQQQKSKDQDESSDTTGNVNSSAKERHTDIDITYRNRGRDRNQQSNPVPDNDDDDDDDEDEDDDENDSVASLDSSVDEGDYKKDDDEDDGEPGTKDADAASQDGGDSGKKEDDEDNDNEPGTKDANPNKKHSNSARQGGRGSGNKEEGDDVDPGSKDGKQSEKLSGTGSKDDAKENSGPGTSVRFSKRASLKYTPNRFQRLSIAETNARPRRLSLCCCSVPVSSSSIFQQEYEVSIKGGDEESTSQSQQTNGDKTRGKNQNACSRHSGACRSLFGEANDNQVDSMVRGRDLRHGNMMDPLHHSSIVCHHAYLYDVNRTKSDTDVSALIDVAMKNCPDMDVRYFTEDSHALYSRGRSRFHSKLHPNFSRSLSDIHACVFRSQYHIHNGTETTLTKSASEHLATRNQACPEDNHPKAGSAFSRQTDCSEKQAGSHGTFCKYYHKKRGDDTPWEKTQRAGLVSDFHFPSRVRELSKQITETDIWSVDTDNDNVCIGIENMSKVTCVKNDWTDSGEKRKQTYPKRTVDQSGQTKQTDRQISNRVCASKQTDQCMLRPDQLKGERESLLETHKITPVHMSNLPQKHVNEEERKAGCLKNGNNTTLCSTIGRNARSQNQDISLMTDYERIKTTHRPDLPENTETTTKTVHNVKLSVRNLTNARTYDQKEVDKNTERKQREEHSEMNVIATREPKMGFCRETSDLGVDACYADKNLNVHHEQLPADSQADCTEEKFEEDKDDDAGDNRTKQLNINSNADDEGRQYTATKRDLQAEPNGLAQVFCREPFAVLFLSTSAEVTKFAVIAIHTDHCDARKEVFAIQSLYDVTSSKWHLEDVIIAGDFVMVDSARGMPNWRGLEIKSDRRFLFFPSSSPASSSSTSTSCPAQPVTGPDHYQQNQDTTTPLTDGQPNYDRLVVAGLGLNRTFISNTVGFYRYDTVLQITDEEARQVSDHFPIEIQIAGRTTTRWHKYARTSAGVVIEQVKPASSSAVGELRDAGDREAGAETGHFTLDILWSVGPRQKSKELRATRSEVNELDVVRALRDFQHAFPGLLRHSTVTVASSYLLSSSSCCSSSFFSSSPIYGLHFPPSASRSSSFTSTSSSSPYHLEVRVSLQPPHVCRVIIQRALTDGFCAEKGPRDSPEVVVSTSGLALS